MTSQPLEAMWGDPHEVRPPEMAPIPIYTAAERMAIATSDEYINALRQAEAACTRAKAERDEALAKLAAHKEGMTTLELRERAHTFTQEMLGLRDQEVQALTLQLDAMTHSVSHWYGKYIGANARKRDYARELRVLLAAQPHWWRFIYHTLRNRALTIEAKQEIS